MKGILITLSKNTQDLILMIASKQFVAWTSA